mgnify:FL=1
MAYKHPPCENKACGRDMTGKRRSQRFCSSDCAADARSQAMTGRPLHSCYSTRKTAQEPPTQQEPINRPDHATQAPSSPVSVAAPAILEGVAPGPRDVISFEEIMGGKRQPVEKPVVGSPDYPLPQHYVYSGRADILGISDTHVPFQKQEFVDAAIRAHSKARICILNGDGTDSYSFSRFVKYEYIHPSVEWAAFRDLVVRLSRTFEIVIIVEGNHDKRLERQIVNNNPQEYVWAIRELAGGSLSPVRALTSDLPNVFIPTNRIEDGVNADWFAWVGDALFAHAEKFSITPGATLRKVDEHFDHQEDVLGVRNPKVIVQAHTHQLGQLWWRRRWLVENGCLCKTHGYQADARIGGRPQARGYVTMTQNDGVTDLNSVRLHYFG